MARTLAPLVRTEVMYTKEGPAYVQHLQDETVVAVQLGYVSTLISFRLCAERGCTCTCAASAGRDNCGQDS